MILRVFLPRARSQAQQTVISPFPLAFFGHFRTAHFFIRGGSGALRGFVEAFLLNRATGACMVRAAW